MAHLRPTAQETEGGTRNVLDPLRNATTDEHIRMDRIYILTKCILYVSIWKFVHRRTQIIASTVGFREGTEWERIVTAIQTHNCKTGVLLVEVLIYFLRCAAGEKVGKKARFLFCHPIFRQYNNLLFCRVAPGSIASCNQWLYGCACFSVSVLFLLVPVRGGRHAVATAFSRHSLDDSLQLNGICENFGSNISRILQDHIHLLVHWCFLLLACCSQSWTASTGQWIAWCTTGSRCSHAVFIHCPFNADGLNLQFSRGISLIEQHGEEHADGLIGIVESFEDSAAGNAGGILADI